MAVMRTDLLARALIGQRETQHTYSLLSRGWITWVKQIATPHTLLDTSASLATVCSCRYIELFGNFATKTALLQVRLSTDEALVQTNRLISCYQFSFSLSSFFYLLGH